MAVYIDLDLSNRKVQKLKATTKIINYITEKYISNNKSEDTKIIVENNDAWSRGSLFET